MQVPLCVVRLGDCRVGWIPAISESFIDVVGVEIAPKSPLPYIERKELKLERFS